MVEWLRDLHSKEDVGSVIVLVFCLIFILLLILGIMRVF